MIFKPHQYQLAAAHALLTHRHMALHADPGTGKTAIVLMLIHELKVRDMLHPTLVLAPLRIATEVWPDEIAKWDQFNEISYSVIQGKNKSKASETPADLHFANIESLPWLVKNNALSKYRILIIDESSKFKNWSAQRTKILKSCISQFDRRYALTGSPAPRSLLDLFSQQYLVDKGAALGRYISHYRYEYFVDKGFGGWPNWQLREGADDRIYKKLAPYCHRIDGDVLLGTPSMLINDIRLTLPKKQQMSSFEALKNLHEMSLSSSFSAADDSILARREAGGIDADGSLIHDVKIKALEDLIAELQGKNALVFFYFRTEGKYLSKHFNAPVVMGGMSQKTTRKHLQAWCAGELPLLFLQPSTTGHGLNLQSGGKDIIWFSFTYSQDDYYQACRRIHGRQGIGARVHRLISRGSVDVAMIASLEAKTGQQKAFLDAIAELTNSSKGALHDTPEKMGIIKKNKTHTT